MNAPFTLTPTRRRAGVSCWPASGSGLTNSANGTNRAARRQRFNEAELVRERREGISEADVTALREREPEKPVVDDPALARAMDLLKGLAVGAPIAALISRLTILRARNQVQGVNAWLNEDRPVCLHRERMPQPDG